MKHRIGFLFTILGLALAACEEKKPEDAPAAKASASTVTTMASAPPVAVTAMPTSTPTPVIEAADAGKPAPAAAADAGKPPATKK